MSPALVGVRSAWMPGDRCKPEQELQNARVCRVGRGMTSVRKRGESDSIGEQRDVGFAKGGCVCTNEQRCFAVCRAHRRSAVRGRSSVNPPFPPFPILLLCTSDEILPGGWMFVFTPCSFLGCEKSRNHGSTGHASCAPWLSREKKEREQQRERHQRHPQTRATSRRCTAPSRSPRHPPSA